MTVTDATLTPRTNTFRDAAIEMAPPWLRDEFGSRYMYSCGINLDTLGEYMRMGVLQGFPQYCQEAALEHIGRDCGIIRGLSETSDAYAGRLRQFKKTWRLAGNAPTLLQQLFALTAPDCVRIRYVTEGPGFTDWWTIDDSGLSKLRVTPGNWNWDNLTGQTRFWIIVYRTDLVPAKWGVPPYAWGEPGLIWAGAPGTNARDWIRDCYSIVSKFAAAGSAMGPWSDFGGGLIVADPTFTAAPWGAGGPFDPTLPAGAPMPNGLWSDVTQRTTQGAVYLSGMA